MARQSVRTVKGDLESETSVLKLDEKILKRDVIVFCSRTSVLGRSHQYIGTKKLVLPYTRHCNSNTERGRVWPDRGLTHSQGLMWDHNHSRNP